MKYDSIILRGDRVALAPNLDLWMAGVRYGTVANIAPTLVDDRLVNVFYVDTDADGRTHAFRQGDLLGAIR